MQANKPLPESFTLDNILANFSTDEQARAFLEKWLWTNGPTCPRCGSNNPERVYRMTGKSTRPGLLNCKDCRRQFTVTVGTIFEDSHIPLRKWLVAWYLLCASKKGISSLQLQRILDLGSYRTALFMTHRIRHALKDESFPKKLAGTVEVDETYVGGHRRGSGSGFVDNKIAVVSLVERQGNVRSMVMERVTATNLKAAINEHVAPQSTVCTDEAPKYTTLPAHFHHYSTCHKKNEYAKRINSKFVAHSNTVECTFSLLKRGIMGTFHSVSKKHLPLYLAEFDHRWNNRKVTDGERTVNGLKKARGKRLTYKAIKA
jgi:transposase-like protein